MKYTRRKMIKGIAAAGALAVSNPMFSNDNASLKNISSPLKGNINHSVCRWSFSSIPLEKFCEIVNDIGFKSIELTTPEEWKTLQKYGLTAAIGTGPFVNLTDGFNDKAYHEKLYKPYMELISKAADNGVPNVVVLTGSKRNMSEEEGLENFAIGTDKLVKHAEKVGVTLIMEMFNSKIDHPDYQADSTLFGVKLVDKIASSSLKLLYDIYHMQIMEGDIIRTITDYKDYIAHYHVAGVPGRHEIDETQELNYKAIMQTIVNNGFKGYVAQEYIPTYKDKIASLRQAIRICDV